MAAEPQDPRQRPRPKWGPAGRRAALVVVPVMAVGFAVLVVATGWPPFSFPSTSARIGSKAAVGGRGRGRRSTTSPVSPASTSTTTTAPPATTTTSPAGRTGQLGATGVFTTAAVAAYLSGQASSSMSITAAVYDVTTGATSEYRPTVALTSASIIKVDILELLLSQAQAQAQAQADGRRLTAVQQTLATKMIELSTDTAASVLWTEVGGAPAIATFDKEVGLTDTIPNVAWGLTTTSALDQLRILECVALANTVLTTTSRDYELTLMTHIEPTEAWGVTSGVPSGVTVALKNGWDPITGIWEINSIGWVHGGGRDYLVAVLSWGKTTMTTGVGVVDGLSSLIWASLSPKSN